jgi:hypothetical protein
MGTIGSGFAAVAGLERSTQNRQTLVLIQGTSRLRARINVCFPTCEAVIDINVAGLRLFLGGQNSAE